MEKTEESLLAEISGASNTLQRVGPRIEMMNKLVLPALLIVFLSAILVGILTAPAYGLLTAAGGLGLYAIPYIFLNLQEFLAVRAAYSAHDDLKNIS